MEALDSPGRISLENVLLGEQGLVSCLPSFQFHLLSYHKSYFTAGGIRVQGLEPSTKQGVHYGR